jgi:TP901 family phage tail tape measure protein
MAGDTNSNIFINIDTSQAMTQLRLLEKELTALNRSLIVGTKAAAAAQAKYAQSLLHNVNATGQWTASMTRMSTASEQFATNLDRQRLSLKEYFRYGAASTKTFGKMLGREFETIEKLVDKRVKTLQQQYVQLGRDAQGAMNAMKFTPKSLNMQNLTTQLMVATQRQQILNKLIDDGSTKLLNFGKNTQWAGRQLMVGFTIPLMLFGAQAIKTFKEIETQTIRFKKVYGDIFTDQGATNAALKNIRALADEYTKYGLTVAETIKTAADAAAAGFSGKGLEQLVEQTNKLAVLGGVTQEKALETTIALKNAFQIDTSAMAGTIDFLNAVENQTVVALEDLTEAIPRVAPVIQQLGGDVKDLAYFMAAMQEGGISAAQGANALKSGLASLINPSNAASKAAAAVGVNIKGIVEANQGNLRNTVTGFAKALQPLTDLERTRVIEKVFGKYQFARISALLNNLGREGTQAARVLQLTNASVEELAILSQREMKVQADSPMNKLAGSVERLKASIAPIGELFAKVFTPVIEFIAKMAEKFNNLPDGIKKAIGVITVVVGGLGPIFLMTFGLLANAVANSVKGVQVLRKGYQQLAAGSTDAALKTQYLSQEELENISISNALYSKHQQLSAAYALEANALTSLTSVYTKANASMGAFAASNPGMFMPRGGVLLPKKFAKGTASVPGPKGAGDVVPAMLSPGESVIPTKQTQKYAGFINQIIQDKVPGFMAGRLGAIPATARTISTRGVIGAKAPVISIVSGSLTRPGLSGIRFTEGTDGLVTVTAGSQSFKVKKESVDELKTLLKDNQDWLESKGRLPGGPVSSVKGYADTTEGKLEHVIRTRLQGKIAERWRFNTKISFFKVAKI